MDNTATPNYLAEVWGEIKTRENRLIGIRDEVRTIGEELVRKYKAVASVINEKHSLNVFVQPFDFTLDTLYYCLDPFSSYSGLLFIADTDPGKIIPIQVVVDPGSPSNFEVRTNPYYSMQSLQARGLTIKDVIVKCVDFTPDMQGPDLEGFKNLITDMPKATDADFASLLHQKLYNLTKKDAFKLSTAKVN